MTTGNHGRALRERVRVEGAEVATAVTGDGPPVVLVHGTPASSFLWRGVVGPLARAHTVYVYDLPGFGDSHPAPGTRPSIAQQARTLAGLVEHWGLDAPALVGHDIGGGVVARAHLVERVAASHLALVDAAVIGPWNTAFTEHQKQHVDAWCSMPHDVFDEIVSTRLRTAVHGPMSDDVFSAYHAPWSGVDGQRRWMEQVDAVDHRDTREAVTRLGAVTAPTLVLWGERDGWLPTSMGDALAAAVPGAVLRTVPDGGHFLPEDQPGRTAELLAAFLSGAR